jgi:hypothetical protein
MLLGDGVRQRNPDKGLKLIRDAAAKDSSVLTVKFRQPSHEFTFGVGMSFISYPLVVTLFV